MGTTEKNGIVGLDNIFDLGPIDEGYSREEDIIPLGDKQEPSKKDEKSIKEGSKIEDDKPDPGAQDASGEGKNNLNTGEVSDDKAQKQDDKLQISTVNYKSILDTLSKRGAIPDLKDVVFGGDNGEEITINDLDFSNEESLCDVLTTIIESQKEDANKDKIDVGSISDITKKLIQADKAGANIVDILKQYDTNVAPIEKLDVENKADQMKIIRHYVDLLGLPKDEADEFYKGIINKGEEYVEAKAMKYKAELDKRMDDIIQQRTQQAAEKKAKDA